MIVILMVLRINGHQKAVRAECRNGKASEILYVSERHMIERADHMPDPVFWFSFELALCMQSGRLLIAFVF